MADLNPEFIAAGIAVAAVAVAALYTRGKHRTAPPAPAYPMDPLGWEIGPIVGGRNYSVGMPLHPSRHPEGFEIEIGPGQQPHYVTRPMAPLVGRSVLTARGRLELPPGVDLQPLDKDEPYEGPAWISLHLQGPDIVTDRWWAATTELKAGEFILQAPLIASLWKPVVAGYADSPAFLASTFARTLTGPVRGGFTLGGPAGLGHGIRATGAARLVVTDFKVE